MPKKSKKEAREAVKESARKRAAVGKKTFAEQGKTKRPHLRGQVNLPIKDILAFVGGDDNTVIAVSRKSLVLAQTANAAQVASDKLNALDALSDL